MKMKLETLRSADIDLHQRLVDAAIALIAALCDGESVVEARKRPNYSEKSAAFSEARSAAEAMVSQMFEDVATDELAALAIVNAEVTGR